MWFAFDHLFWCVTPNNFGVHLSGGYSSLSYGCPVTQEDLECYDRQFGAMTEGYYARGSRTVCEMPIDIELSDDLEMSKVLPEGDYVIHGVVSPTDSIRPAGKTQIIPTVLHGTWEVTKEPAVLRPGDPRSKSDVSPMQKCLRKYGELLLIFLVQEVATYQFADPHTPHMVLPLAQSDRN